MTAPPRGEPSQERPSRRAALASPFGGGAPVRTLGRRGLYVNEHPLSHCACVRRAVPAPPEGEPRLASPFGGGVAKRRRGRTANRHPVRNCTGCLLMLNSNYSVQDLFKGEMFGFCHCEPVTDVTGAAIRSSQRLGTISEMFSASGGRIATLVCSLARNDGVN